MSNQTVSLENFIVFEDYAIVCSDHQYRMDFKVYTISGRIENKVTKLYDVPTFGDECSEKLDGIETFREGAIKWDGCSNWDFKTHDCMAHFCGRRHATSIGRLMEKLYELASSMKDFDSITAA